MLPRVPGDQGSCGADYLPAGYSRERALLQHLLGAGEGQRLPDNRDMSQSGASSLCGEQLVRGQIQAVTGTHGGLWKYREERPLARWEGFWKLLRRGEG